VHAALRQWVRAFVVAVVVLGSATVVTTPARAAAPLLTTAQRQAYLYYYAPLILKRGDENDSKQGRDWLTNYDFDQDGDFSTNRLDWLQINRYTDASAAGAASAYDRWRIRPTLYSSVIEFMDGGVKSLVLLYHVYNAADKEGSDIHDWERVEIIVRNVTGSPGGSEYVSSATLTHHDDHVMRRYGDSGFNFMSTTTGRHLMVWQADEAGQVTGTHGHELRFVTNPYATVAGQSPSAKAEVNVSGKDEKKSVHYVFVPQASAGAVAAWGARPLTYANAGSQASRIDNEDKVTWAQAKRLTYELQDLADIIPTHWQGANWPRHWLSDEAVDITLESPVVNEAGQAEVSTGRQRFYTRSRDAGSSSLTDGRNGIPSKSWFYGAYSAELDEDFPSGSDDFKGFAGGGTDSYGYSRGLASGRLDSHGQYWWQHDFFVHSGAIDSAETREAGRWLPGAWYTAENGGFDGRWVQLFDDRPGAEAAIP
jgi:hypothetical protein